MLTLEQAIEHCHEKAKELNDTADNWKRLSDEKGLALPSDYEPCKECANEHEQLAAWLEELAKRRETDRWIPVSERLPEQTTAYLVTIKFIEDYEECIMTDTVIYNIKYGWNTADEVIAWKPLPKPYESEAENEC